MKKYQVVLSKSYLVTVYAETPQDAKFVSEFFTGNSQDLSTIEDRQREKFKFEEIKCTVNDTFDCVEL